MCILSRWWLLAILAVLGCSTRDHAHIASLAPDVVPATDAGRLALVHFIGRFDTTDPEHPRCAFPGSGFETTFIGTGIAVTLVDLGP